MGNAVAYLKLHGADAKPYIDELGALRIKVFRDFPYLYDGDMKYELEYLESYFSCERSIVVLALNGGAVVGATTAMPLNDAEREWQAPFESHGIDTDRIFYFGESVLLPEFRGQGIGQAFFDFREAHAASFPSFDSTSFCAVRRSITDERRPTGYRPLDDFWKKRGYVKNEGLTASFSWREVGSKQDVAHVMDFWLRKFR